MSEQWLFTIAFFAWLIGAAAFVMAPPGPVPGVKVSPPLKPIRSSRMIAGMKSSTESRVGTKYATARVLNRGPKPQKTSPAEIFSPRMWRR